jgi:hypothetical protein
MHETGGSMSETEKWSSNPSTAPLYWTEQTIFLLIANGVLTVVLYGTGEFLVSILVGRVGG